jgi:hypothetical protein
MTIILAKKVRVIRDGNKPVNFVATVTRVMVWGVHVWPVPKGCHTWYAWEEVAAL